MLEYKEPEDVYLADMGKLFYYYDKHSGYVVYRYEYLYSMVLEAYLTIREKRIFGRYRIEREAQNFKLTFKINS